MRRRDIQLRSGSHSKSAREMREKETGTWGHPSGGGQQGEDVFRLTQIDINDQYKVHSWEEKCRKKLILDPEDTGPLE